MVESVGRRVRGIHKTNLPGRNFPAVGQNTGGRKTSGGAPRSPVRERLGISIFTSLSFELFFQDVLSQSSEMSCTLIAPAIFIVCSVPAARAANEDLETLAHSPLLLANPRMAGSSSRRYSLQLAGLSSNPLPTAGRRASHRPSHGSEETETRTASHRWFSGRAAWPHRLRMVERLQQRHNSSLHVVVV